MIESEIGFIINQVVTDDATYWHLVGRCGDRPIHVGDVFRAIDIPAGAFVTSRNLPVLNDESRGINLRVERIRSYGQELSELGSGMTGTIDLTGDGIEWAIVGATLGLLVPDAPPRPSDVGNVACDHRQDATT